jgi:hypothetical protein
VQSTKSSPRSTISVHGGRLHKRGLFAQERPRAPSQKITPAQAKSSNAGSVRGTAITANEEAGASQGTTIIEDTWAASIREFHIACESKCCGGRDHASFCFLPHSCSCSSRLRLVLTLTLASLLASNSCLTLYALSSDDIPKPLIKAHPAPRVNMLKVPVDTIFPIPLLIRPPQQRTLDAGQHKYHYTSPTADPHPLPVVRRIALGEDIGP